MNNLKATVVIPTYNHGPTLRPCVESVLSQTEQSFEIFIVGDAATKTTRDTVNELLQHDKRIRFFDNAKKSARTGERYRAEALKSARGEIICYLSDDDLWLPNHIESMYNLLQQADFAHSFPALIDQSKKTILCPADLSNDFYFNLQQAGQSLIALSFVAHTKKFYDKLPFGWQDTPKEFYTDFYMWKQFLDQPSCIVACTKQLTSIKVISPEMNKTTLEQSADFLKKAYAFFQEKHKSKKLIEWQLDLALSATLSAQERLMQLVEHDKKMQNQLKESLNVKQQQINAYENSMTWRAKKRLLKLPLISAASRKLAVFLAKH